MKIRRFVVGPVATNCYVVINEENKEAFVVDPGAGAVRISTYLREEGVSPKAILLTHGHFDHVGAVAALKEEWGMKVYAHKAEKNTLVDPDINLSTSMGAKPESFEATDYFEDNDVLNIADYEIKAFHTPGHTAGGACYYFKCDDSYMTLFSGDTLFQGSVGRTDFPGGSMSQIVNSIKEKLLTLNDATDVLPGHGEETTIGEERYCNPYL